MTTNRKAASLVWSLLASLTASAQEGPNSLWAQREYGTWDNGLQSEISLNGATLDILSSDKILPFALKPGWNKISVKTAAQPANKDNGLIFRIGPMHDKSAREKVMQPVLWKFGNGTDWRFSAGKYSHPLGPGVQEVTHDYKLYYAGMELENREVKAGDYVLIGKPDYETWNSPVSATVYVNGTPLNSFTVQPRQVVITPLLKPGRNDIKIVSTRVKNAIKNNDIKFAILGPAEWSVGDNKFVMPSVVQFGAKQGWTMDRKSGQLVNAANPSADDVERVVPFMMKTP